MTTTLAGQVVIDLPGSRPVVIAPLATPVVLVQSSRVPVVPVGVVELFSGSGSLSASLYVIAKTAASFGGAGSLSASISAIATTGAAFTGAGALSAEVRAAIRAGFAGSGTLQADGFGIARTHADFSGIGTLQADAIQGATVAATFSGSGSLSAASTAHAEVAAAFGGSGSVSALIQVSGGGYIVAADFTGSGSLSAVIVPAFAVAADFTSTGSLGAQAKAAFLRGADFTGSGSLSATSLVAIPVTAPLAGSGGLTAAVGVGVAATFGGSGALSATVATSFMPMQMTKSTTQTLTSSYSAVTNWSATNDGTYTSTVTGDALQAGVAKSNATVRADLVCSSGSSSRNFSVRVKRNGTVIGTSSVVANPGTATVTISNVNVVIGDLFTVEGDSDGATNFPVVQTTSFLRIT